MQISSNFIPLNNGWGFLEFEYNSIIKSTNEFSFLRIKNSFSGTMNYTSFHPDNYTKTKNFSNNVLDTTAQQISENDWVHFDIDRPLKFFETVNQPIYFQSVHNAITSEKFITYHTLKLNILRGFNFDGQDGFMVRICYKDNEGNKVWVSNTVYLKGEESLVYHTKNFRIGDNLYDRYFEIKIPSIQSLKVIDDALPDEMKENDSFYYKTSNGNFPNIDKTQINIYIYDINNTKIDTKGQLILSNLIPLESDSKGIIPIQIDTYDIFTGVSAILRESKNGDYFELFPSYNGQFIEDYLFTNPNFSSGQFLIFHDIDLIEQSMNGGKYSEITTQSITFIQEEHFDRPYVFRPVILNDSTITFTIEYFVRIIDKISNSQIIRKSILTYPDAKKYGKYLKKIDVNQSNPIKIINKIDRATFNDSTFMNYSYPYLKNHMFFEMNPLKSEFLFPFNFNNISINQKRIYARRDTTFGGIIEEFYPEKNEETDIEIYPFNEHILSLNDFDNFIHFTIYRNTEDKKLERYTLINDSKTKYYLVLEDDQKNKRKFDLYDFPENTNFRLFEGEMVFRITADEVDDIKNSEKYWIIMENYIQKEYDNVVTDMKNFEVLIYSGKVQKI